jgi:hypothetical protein
MNDLTASLEPATGHVMLAGIPSGAAGEAVLTPVPGLELAFDRADGCLCRAIVYGVRTDGGKQVAAMLVRLFGPEAADVVLGAATSRGTAPPRAGVLDPEPGVAGALSRLARLYAVRATSPVPPGSPRWAAEAAKLGARAGLPALASAQAGPQLPSPIAAPVLDVAAEVERLEKDRAHPADLNWALDPGAPGTVPEGFFQLGLSPYSDLAVRHEEEHGGIVIEARLASGADCGALREYRIRLADPEIRRILAQTSFTEARARVWAELRPTFPLDEVPESWIEVVRAEKCPVSSLKSHRIRRALRWADAALRAERKPAGLDPAAAAEDWLTLAAAAWERCRLDWAAVGDTDRAYLALIRRAALRGTRVPPAPSETAARIARRVPLASPDYQAEAMG